MMAQPEVKAKFEFQIPSGQVNPDVIYNTNSLFPSEKIDRRVIQRELVFIGKKGPFTFEYLHYGGTLPVVHKSSTTEQVLDSSQYVEFRLPNTTPEIERLKKRLREIELSDDQELYLDDSNTLQLRYKNELDPEEEITEEDLAKIGAPKREKSILDEVINRSLKNLDVEIEKSKMQKEGTQMLKFTIEHMEYAMKCVGFCASPPAASTNPMKNEITQNWIENFIESNCINVAQMLVNDIISLVKYTKYEEDFFGITNEDLGVAMTTANRTLAAMKSLNGIERVTMGLQSLVNGLVVIMPDKVELTQRKTREPTLPSGGLRTDAARLTS